MCSKLKRVWMRWRNTNLLNNKLWTEQGALGWFERSREHWTKSHPAHHPPLLLLLLLLLLHSTQSAKSGRPWRFDLEILCDLLLETGKLFGRDGREVNPKKLFESQIFRRASRWVCSDSIWLPVLLYEIPTACPAYYHRMIIHFHNFILILIASNKLSRRGLW